MVETCCSFIHIYNIGKFKNASDRSVYQFVLLFIDLTKKAMTALTKACVELKPFRAELTLGKSPEWKALTKDRKDYGPGNDIFFSQFILIE